MKTAFSILLSVKTGNETESYCRFYLGNDREEAIRIFRQLEGSDTVHAYSPLLMELVETVNGLPVNLHLRACSLKQLAHNCAFITREIFRLKNLQQAM